MNESASELQRMLRNAMARRSGRRWLDAIHELKAKDKAARRLQKSWRARRWRLVLSRMKHATEALSPTSKDKSYTRVERFQPTPPASPPDGSETMMVRNFSEESAAEPAAAPAPAAEKAAAATASPRTALAAAPSASAPAAAPLAGKIFGLRSRIGLLSPRARKAGKIAPTDGANASANGSANGSQRPTPRGALTRQRTGTLVRQSTQSLAQKSALARQATTSVAIKSAKVVKEKFNARVFKPPQEITDIATLAAAAVLQKKLEDLRWRRPWVVKLRIGIAWLLNYAYMFIALFYAFICCILYGEKKRPRRSCRGCLRTRRRLRSSSRCKSSCSRRLRASLSRTTRVAGA